MNKKSISAAIFAASATLSAFCAQGATLVSGDMLTITTGVPVYGSNSTVTNFSGSYYGVDTNGNSKITNAEKVVLAQGTTGLVIGVTTTPGAYHSGTPVAGDTNAITAPDVLYGETGSWYTTVPITGGTTNGLDMSGWNWAWNGISSIPLGSLAWQPANCAALGCSGHTFIDGVALFQWDGLYGDAYTIDFASTVQQGDPSSLGGVHFYTHLEGTVTCGINAYPEGGCPQTTATPLPTAAWLLGSGLLGLVGMARRKAV